MDPVLQYLHCRPWANKCSELSPIQRLCTSCPCLRTFQTVDSLWKNSVDYSWGRRCIWSHIVPDLLFPVELFYSFKGTHLENFLTLIKGLGWIGVSSEVINSKFQHVFKLENEDLAAVSYLSEPCWGYSIIRAAYCCWRRQFGRIYQKPWKKYMPFVLENSSLGTVPR